LDIGLGNIGENTTSSLGNNAISHLSNKGYPEYLSKAFMALCKYMASDKLLQEIHSVIKDNENKDILKNTIEQLLRIELPKLLSPEASTPSQLNQLCLAILKPTCGTFYDGTSGISNTIVDACLYAQNNNGKLQIRTQEINALYHALSIVRAFINDIDGYLMHCGDTLTSPETKSTDYMLQKFDYSIMFPPLGLSWKNIAEQVYSNQYGRFPFGFPPTSSADWLFIQHQYASLNKGGRGIIAVTSGALFNEATSKIRKAFISAGIIEGIVTLPSGMLSHTNIPISLMIISNIKKADAEMIMVHAENLFTETPSVRLKDVCSLDSYKIEHICNILQNKQQISSISRVVDIETLEDNDWILLPKRYVYDSVVETEYGKLTIKQSYDKNWTQLGNIGSFYRGINVAPSTIADENGQYGIINLIDIQNGELNLDKLSRYNLTTKVNPQKYQVIPGDILVSCKGLAVKICVVPHHFEPTLLSINFIGIHVNQSKFDPYFVKYYLESPVGQVFLRNKQVGTSIITLTTRDLEKILLPNLPLDEQRQHVQRLTDTEYMVRLEMERLYTQSRQAKWNFYQEIGLGEIMESGEEKDNG